MAIKYAQGLIDGVLNLHFGGAKSAHELMTHYTISGSEVPKIYGEPGADFHAYRYAREKAFPPMDLPDEIELSRTQALRCPLDWR